MKKIVILVAIGAILIAVCSACKVHEDAVCPPEDGLTQAECNNAGTHQYQAHLEIEGIGGINCSAEDGSSERDAVRTYTFTFFEGEGVMYEHPDNLVWDSVVQPLMRTDENQYIYLGAEEDMLQTWEVEFFTWGFSEKLTITWDCGEDICGCVTTAENEIDD